MQEITLFDAINHFKLKIEENSEQTKTLSERMVSMLAICEEGWGGMAGSAFRDKIEHYIRELEKVQLGLEEAKAQLTAAAAAYAEGLEE